MSWGRTLQREFRQQVGDAASTVQDPAERDRLVAAMFDSRTIRERLAEGIRDHADLEIIFTLLEMPSVAVRASADPGLMGVWAYGTVFVANESVVAVYAFGLFVVAVTQIDVTPIIAEPADQAFNRVELQRIAGTLASRLEECAAELRASGVLTTFAEG